MDKGGQSAFMKHAHGGDVHGFEARRGFRPLDFSASLNPLGTPAAVLAAAKKAVDDSASYPDPECRKLASALGGRLGVAPDNLVFDNGAAALIFRLVRALAPRTALAPAPFFAEYEAALFSVGCRIETYALGEDRDFAPAADMLDLVEPGMDAVFWCQPNNPTGRLAEPGLMRALLAKTARVGARLVVDECFLPFVADHEQYSLRACVGDHPHLFIIDSFTKLYAMAGIRLGYGLTGDRALHERLTRAGQTWPVSTVAQAAGLAALDCDDYVRDALALIGKEKECLISGLARLGIAVTGSAANYLFFRADPLDLDRRLAEQGMLIRNCDNFRGLRPGWWRIAVRGREDNARLLAALAVVRSGTGES